MKFCFKIALFVCGLTSAVHAVRAQTAAPPPAPAYQLLSDSDLDQLLGPIALYPDPLIAQILPAATLPEQIVLADRYVSSGGNRDQIDQQPWDASVQALAHYPDVLKWMDDNLAWTTQLGQAFLNQQPAVMQSIQRLRQSAVNLGNLQTSPQQQVVNDGAIEIVPADPQIIYVPVYQPAQVYYQPCPGPSFINFSVGFAIGDWLNCDFDWRNQNIVVWNRAHPRPLNWWHEPSRQRNYNHVVVWHPNYYSHAAAINWDDRGWNIPRNQPVVATVNRSVSDSAAPRSVPLTGARPTPSAAWPGGVSHHSPATRPAPVPATHYPVIKQPEANGAFIGIQSSETTKNYSNRGQQSVGTMPHPPVSSPPATRPAPHPSNTSPGNRNPNPGH